MVLDRTRKDSSTDMTNEELLQDLDSLASPGLDLSPGDPIAKLAAAKIRELLDLLKETYQTYPPEMMSGIKALVKPDYHKLNVHDSRNDRLLHAVMCAYAVEFLEVNDIGHGKLGDILHNAIANAIGSDEYCRWSDRIKAEMEVDHEIPE